MSDRIIISPSHSRWMRSGMPVIFRPEFGPGDEQKMFFGRLAGKPFLAGKPSSGRWVVRIEDMDDEYVKIYGTTVHPNASIDRVWPLEPGKVSP